MADLMPSSDLSNSLRDEEELEEEEIEKDLENFSLFPNLTPKPQNPRAFYMPNKEMPLLAHAKLEYFMLGNSWNYFSR